MEGDKKRISIIDPSSVEDEADVFEITDFTTASEWERFIARIEEILHEWKLVNQDPRPPALKDQYAHGTWAEKTEQIVFADFRFVFSYMYLKTHEDTAPASSATTKKEGGEGIDDEHKSPTVFFDLMNFENDFPSRAHYLCRWYGLQEFCTISPACDKQPIESESRSKLLLSSASIAFSNSNCSIPVFVHVQQKWRKLFTGTCVTRGASIEFEMAHLRRFPSQYCHLAGLLDVFKSKLGCVYISMPPVSVAVRFTYVLQDWIHSAWPQLPPDFSSFCDGEVGYGDIGFMPFGACRDPISELHLSCTWPCLSEDIIVENSLYSDLDPLQAPSWTACLQMTEDPQCLLGEYLQDFLKLCDRVESTEEVLRKVLLEAEGTDGEIPNALQRLTEPVPSLSSIPSLGNVMSTASSRIKLKPEEAPIPDSVLDKILYYLFPEAKTYSSANINSKLEKDKRQGSMSSSSISTTPDSEKPLPGATETPALTAQQQNLIKEVQAELNKQLKSASPDSLTHKLSLALCNVNHNHGGLLGVAHLWQEFILELRFRWENKFLLTGLEKGAPNMGSCLLHQKLQMLNCCIECKIKRESAGYGYGPDSLNTHDQSFDSHEADDRDTVDGGAEGTDQEDQSVKRTSVSTVSSDEEDDEFFECDDDSADGESSKQKSSDGQKEESEIESGAKVEAKGDQSDASTTDSRRSISSPDETDKGIARKKKRKSNESRNSMLLSFHDSLTHRPEGRMVPMKNMFLLSNSEQMYIPFTQEPSPMTEDMLEEHAEILAKLGTSAEGSQIRARMQSACLVSDMESFKAANPGCTLEDFVRWYSPRDYVIDEGGVECPLDEQEEQEEASVSEERKEEAPKAKRGHLSQRMQIPGNMWVEAWQSAKPVPARRQKRLFDDTKEAEKVLHYLSSMKPAEVVLHLMPCVAHAAIAKQVEESVRCNVPNMKNLTDQLISRATTLTRNFPLDRKKYFDLLRVIERAETITARTKSLRSKFSHDLAHQSQEGKEEEIESFVTNLLSQTEVPVKGGACGPAGAIIHKMFIAVQKSNHMILDDEEEGVSDRAETASTSSRSDGGGSHSRKNSAFLASPTLDGHVPSTCPDFPPASAREYILRAMVPRPASYSKVLPQRLYCLLTDGDNRLAGAFTSDSTFQ